MVSLLVIPHFLMTAYAVKSQQHALQTGSADRVTGTYDGTESSAPSALPIFPDLQLSFGAKKYEAPGGLHGVELLPEIRSKLVKGSPYLLHVNDGVVLKIERAE